MMNKKMLLLMLLLCIHLLPAAFAHADDPVPNCDDLTSENLLFVNKNLTPETSGCTPDELWYVGKESPFECVPYENGHLNIPATFSGTTRNKKVMENEPVTGIDNEAFNNYNETVTCAPLTSVTIPNTILIIDENAFSETGLTSVNIPASVEQIKSSAFDSCTSLEEVTFGTGTHIRSISDRAFYACSSLKSVKIPDGKQGEAGEKWNMDAEAFGNCTSLTVIEFEGAIPQLDEFDRNTFGWDESQLLTYSKDTKDTRVILCNEENYSDAAGRNDWSKQFGISDITQIAVPLPEGVTVTVANVVYNGEARTPEHTVEGMQTAGSDPRFVYYDKDGAPVRDENEDLALSLTNAGTYDVDIFIKGSNDVNYYTKGSWTIDKAPQKVLTVSVADWKFGENANAPQLSDEPLGNVTTTYLYKSDDDEDWTPWGETTGPTAVGNYQLKAVISGDPNYVDYETAPMTFKIKGTVTPESGFTKPTLKYPDGIVYDGESHPLIVPGDGAPFGTMLYRTTFARSAAKASEGFVSDTPQGTEAGIYTIAYTIIDPNGNYESVPEVLGELKAEISRAVQDSELTVLIDEEWSSGDPAPTLSGTPSGNVRTEIRYKSDDDEDWTPWGETDPSAPGQYKVKAVIWGDPNYEDYETEAVSFTVRSEDDDEELLFFLLTIPDHLPSTGFPTGIPD